MEAPAGRYNFTALESVIYGPGKSSGGRPRRDSAEQARAEKSP